MQVLVFLSYSLFVVLFFFFLLGVLSRFTNSWLYFSILSEKTNLSISDLKNIHYAFIITMAVLWAYDSYRRFTQKHKKKLFMKHEVIDHHAKHLLKSIVLPFTLLMFFLFAAFLALVQTFGPATYQMRMNMPNDPIETTHSSSLPEIS